jgi:hypothetical protein
VLLLFSRLLLGLLRLCCKVPVMKKCPRMSWSVALAAALCSLLEAACEPCIRLSCCKQGSHACQLDQARLGKLMRCNAEARSGKAIMHARK